ncbi:MAG: ABC transporter permease [Gammaproteobacteria bacterium]
MFDADTWQEILNTVRSNRLRTFLTASGVFWGIFILIVMLGFGNGLETGVKSNMTGFASNGYYVWGKNTSIPYRGFQPGRRINLTSADTVAIRENIPEIAHLVPRAELGSRTSPRDVVRNTQAARAHVMADFPVLRHILPMRIETGRFINRLDIEERRKVAVIGEEILASLFNGGEDPVGATITIQQINFTVIGVFKPQRYGSNRERLSTSVFIPFTTFQHVFNHGDRIGYYGLIPHQGFSSKEVGEKVRLLLAERHNVSPKDTRAFGHLDTQEEFNRVDNLFRGIRFLIWTVGVVTLLAGVLGVSNIMLIVIRERTKEFGLRKALGATPDSIIYHVTQETVLLTGVAGYLGLVAGIGALQLLDLFTRSYTPKPGGQAIMFASPTVGFDVALIATGVIILSGAIAAIIPARRAASINPVVALRAE